MLCANNISSAPILNRVFLYIHHAKVIKYRKVYFRTIERIKINIYKSTCTATPIPNKFISLILTVPTIMQNISDHKRKTIKSINLTCFSKFYLWNWEVKKKEKKSTFYLSFCCRKTLTWLAYKNAFHRQEHHYNNNHTGVHHKLDSSVHRQGLGLKFQGRRSYSLIFLLMCDSLDLRYLHLFFLIWYSDDCGQYIRKVLLFEFFTHKFHCWECE